jgi:hypothetical protein
MRRFFSPVLVTLGVLALAGTVLAHQAAPAGQAKGTSRAHMAGGAAAGMAAIGTIKSFAGGTLTVTTKTGDETFTVGAETKIMEGTKTLKVDDLPALAGNTAKVSYTKSGDMMTATRITVHQARPKGTSPK